MQITKSDIHSASKDSNGGLSPGYDSELVVVIRAGDYDRLRGLRDAIERLVDVHRNGPNYAIEDNNISPESFDAALKALGASDGGYSSGSKVTTRSALGLLTFTVALRRGEVIVDVGGNTSTIRSTAPGFTINYGLVDDGRCDLATLRDCTLVGVILKAARDLASPPAIEPVA